MSLLIPIFYSRSLKQCNLIFSKKPNSLPILLIWISNKYYIPHLFKTKSDMKSSLSDVSFLFTPFFCFLDLLLNMCHFHISQNVCSILNGKSKQQIHNRIS